MNSIVAIAKNTYTEMIRDKILYVILFFGLGLLILSLLLSHLTVNERIRLAIDFGISGVHICMVVLSIFLGSTLIFREIDKKTILFIMSYPVSRTQFLLGKFLGFSFVLAVVLLGLSAGQLVLIKLLGWQFHGSFLIALLGIYLEVMLLLSITLAFGVFVRPVIAVGASVGFFLIGHGMNSFYEIAQKSQKFFIKSFSELLMWIFPNLEYMNWKNFISYDEYISGQLFFKSIVYSLGWTVFFLCISILFFRRRDFV